MNSKAAKDNKAAIQAAAKREALRRLAATDLRAYVHYTMPSYRESWHHRAFITALQAVADGVLTNLIITAPPRHGKSELISRRFPAFLVGGAWPGVSLLSASHTQDLANKMSRDVQRILCSAEHKAIFPNFEFGERKAFEEFDLADGSTYKAAGVGGPIAGRGANIGFVDDPVANRARAESKAERERTKEWWADDFSTRMEPPGARVLTATRWHTDDLTGHILGGPGAEDWVHIHFPAILDQHPPPFDGDPRQIGEPLWPGRYINPRRNETIESVPHEELVQRALKDLEAKRTLNPYGFQALYQGWPTLRGGGLFRREALQTYTSHPAQIAAICEWLCISVDATFGASKRSDYVAICVVGGKGANRYLLDEYRVRATYPETKTLIKSVQRKWPRASVLIETKANGQALLDDLKGELSRVIPFNPKEGKPARASYTAEIWSAGQFWAPTVEHMPTLEEWIQEFTGFGSLPHDDRVDALAQVLIHHHHRADALANLRRIVGVAGGELN